MKEDNTPYLVMDTCCFSHYYMTKEKRERVKGLIHFDYDALKAYCKEHGVRIAITPYTFYECIQKCDSPEMIRMKKEAFDRVGVFWIINHNNLLDGTTVGTDFLKRFDFDNPEAFRKQRDEWGRKVYETLGPRLFLLAQIIAITYLIITETDNNDIGSRDTLAKMNVINEVYSNYGMLESQFKSFAETPSYYLFRDQKKEGKTDFKQNLLGYLENMALLMIIGAEQVIATIKNNRSEMTLPYAHPISIHQMFRERYAREKMVDKYAEFKRRPKSDDCAEHTVEALIDEFFLPKSEIVFKGFFKKIAHEWFEQKEFGGGKIPNFLVDYVNLGVLEVGRGLPLAYITEDDTFAMMVKGSDDAGYAESKRYYERFWIGGDEC